MKNNFFSIRYTLALVAGMYIVTPILLGIVLRGAKELQKFIDVPALLLDWSLARYIVVSQTIALCIGFFLIRKSLTQRQLNWASIGLRTFHAFRAAKYIIGYFLILLGLLVVLAAGSAITGIMPPEPRDTPASAESFNRLGGLWPALIVSVLLAPFIEELLFRGLLFTSLKARYTVLIAAMVSSLVFAVAHLNPAQAIGAFLVGPYLCLMYQRLGSIIPGMLLHAIWNGLVVIIAANA